MTGTARIQGLDAFRLLGALCVVALHVNSASYPLLDTALSDDLRLASRWAVPFFFIVTGYLLAHRGLERALPGTLARAVVIAVMANLLLLPYDWLWLGPRSTLLALLDPKVLALGVQVHLWYLGANVLGLLALFAVQRYADLRWLALPALGAIVLTAVTGAYYPPAGFGFVMSRELLAISFLWIGLRLAHRAPGVRLSLALVLGGLVLQWLESRWLVHRWGVELRTIEFLFGTVPLAVGVFGLALAWRPGIVVDRLGALGARYSLGLYVLHPYALEVVHRRAAALGWQGRPVGLLLLAMAFGATLAVLWLVNRVWPRGLDLLAGDPRAWRGGVRAS